MKKNVKRVLSFAVVTAMVLGFAACGDTSSDTGATPTVTPTTAAVVDEGGTTNEPEKEAFISPEGTQVKTITVMFDGTVFTQENGRDALEAALEEVISERAGYDVDIVIVQPDHSGYYTTVSQTFAGAQSTWPDIILLGSSYYASYAGSGVLTDISYYYENSEFKNSGRIVNEGIMDILYVDDALYGISPARGNGCVTYVKQDWLDAVKMTAPTTYAEYTAMLEAFQGLSTENAAVTSAGIVNAEAPYVNYLPEFFQDAYPDFYQKDGVWVDGFTEPEMEEALDRLIEAYDEGWLDVECITNNTKAARTKFTEGMQYGAFSYWAGSWAETLSNTLIKNGLDGDLVTLEPIAEVGTYMERMATAWGITSACENPDIVFDLFFETMLDGAEGQTLWTYGVEGVHWSTEAETLVLNPGLDSESTVTYEAGEFHGEVNLETSATQYKKNHIDAMLSAVSFIDTSFGMEVDDRAAISGTIFNANCSPAPYIKSTETLRTYQSEIMTFRIQLVNNVVTGEKSIADAMAEYKATYGTQIEEILASLNAE